MTPKCIFINSPPVPGLFLCVSVYSQHTYTYTHTHTFGSSIAEKEAEMMVWGKTLLALCFVPPSCNPAPSRMWAVQRFIWIPTCLNATNLLPKHTEAAAASALVPWLLKGTVLASFFFSLSLSLLSQLVPFSPCAASRERQTTAMNAPVKDGLRAGIKIGMQCFRLWWYRFKTQVCFLRLLSSFFSSFSGHLLCLWYQHLVVLTRFLASHLFGLWCSY